MNIPMKSIKPRADHLAFRKALEAAVAEHGKSLDAMELLALLAHLVGQVIALQDQRTVTPRMAMEVVESNIELGNRDVVDRLVHQTGGTA